MKTILYLFGYVKIPKAAVQLSIEQERFLELIRDHVGDRPFETLINKHIKGQKTLTEFLRSGRL